LCFFACPFFEKLHASSYEKVEEYGMKLSEILLYVIGIILFDRLLVGLGYAIWIIVAIIEWIRSFFVASPVTHAASKVTHATSKVTHAASKVAHAASPVAHAVSQVAYASTPSLPRRRRRPLRFAIARYGMLTQMRISG
jgi:hypothetical protein